MSKKIQQIVAFAFGVVFVVTLLVLAVQFPNPTHFQYLVFKVVLSLAAAGVAAMIPGFLTVNVSGVVQAGGALGVFVVVYFFNPASLLVDDPADSSFEVSLHDRVVNMEQWKYVAEADMTKKISRVEFVDKIKVKRLGKDAREFMVRHATTSSHDIDISSDSHRINVRPTAEQPEGGMRSAIRIFDVYVDVGGEPVNETFEVRLKSVYWNSMNNAAKGWAGLPLLYKTQRAVFELVFPTSRPVTYWERRQGSRDSKESELVSDGALQARVPGHVLTWTIDRPNKNWVYKFQWDW